MEPLDFQKLREELNAKHSESVISDQDVISAALYPKVFDDFKEFRSVYGPVDKLDTRTFFVGPDIAENITVRPCPHRARSSTAQCKKWKIFHYLHSAAAPCVNTLLGTSGFHL